MGLEIDLSEHGPERLRDAIRDLMQQAPESLVPSASRLKQGAEAVVVREETGGSAAYFQSLLEIGYLVASADGFADEERSALADLLEAVMGASVSHEVLDLHFRDLEDGVEMLGRRERLRRAADDFEDGLSRSEALGFAALVAVADGKLAAPEAAALKELGSFLGLSDDEVVAAVERVTAAVAQQVQQGGAS